MAKLAMKKIEIAALQTDTQNIMERLQRRGVLQLIDCSDENTVKVNMSANVSILEKNLQTANRALESLNLFAPKSGIKDSLKSLTKTLSGREEIEKKKFGKRAEQINDYMNICYTVNAAVQKIAENKASIARKTAEYDQLAVWQALDLPQQFDGTKNAACFIGTLPAKAELLQLQQAFSDNPETDTAYLQKIGGKEQTLLAVFCHRSQKQAVFSALREKDFYTPSDPTKHPPKVRLNRLQDEIAALKQDSAVQTEKVLQQVNRREDICFLIDWLTLKRDRYAAFANVELTQSTMIIRGFVPSRNAAALVTELEKKYCIAVTLTDPAPEDDVPVLLSNSGFSAPVEGITEMYALPAKQDLDPTPIISFFYYLFFGMMLSDAGYGLIMTVATALILKFSKIEGNLRRSLKMFCYCGISTVFWGAMFGSWFGDIIPVIAREYFGKTITSADLALWFEPMADPIHLLLISLALGVVHLFVGVAVNGYMKIKQHRIFEAIFDTVPIYMMILGVLPFGAGILTPVNAALKQNALYLSLAGVVLFLVTSGHGERNVLKRLGGNLYALYNIASGYLGDILSYSRLLALGLATGSIAGVINMMAVMPSDKVAKTVLLLVVFPLGHLLNIAINLLGAYVHTARLQFVEMFSKFYEGGGKPFEPLKVNTKYVKFKEENLS